MIQLQVLNKVLTDKDMALIADNNFDERHFNQYPEEFEFIVNHFRRYGNVPDDATVLEKFPGFSLLDVQESNSYLSEALTEEFTYNEMVPILNDAAARMQQNSYEAVKFLLPKVRQILETSSFIGGQDIMRNASTRWDWYNQLKNSTELLGMSTGLPELDDIFGGWLPGEELVVIAGRPNQGKSWIADIFLANAWKQKKKVLLYSGEMGTNLVASRIDTILSGLSNKGIQRAALDSASEKQYREHLEWAKSQETSFVVVTPNDLGNRYLTMSMLDSLIVKHKPDIVGVDQLSLLTDERAGRDPLRLQYHHLTQDMFSIGTKHKIPILLAVQANRRAQEKDDNETPDLEDLNESDSIGQNSSRVISIRQTAEGLKLSIKKNRYGENNITLTYYWDIDKGQLTFMPDDSVNERDSTSPRVESLKARSGRRKEEVRSKANVKEDVF